MSVVEVSPWDFLPAPGSIVLQGATARGMVELSARAWVHLHRFPLPRIIKRAIRPGLGSQPDFWSGHILDGGTIRPRLGSACSLRKQIRRFKNYPSTPGFTAIVRTFEYTFPELSVRAVVYPLETDMWYQLPALDGVPRPLGFLPIGGPISHGPRREGSYAHSSPF